MNDKKLKILFVSPDSYYPENLNGVNKINFNLVKKNCHYSVDYLAQSYEGTPPQGTCVEKYFSLKNDIPKRTKLSVKCLI